MAVGLWHRLDRTGRNLLPFATTLLLMLVAMTPTRLPGFADVAPMLALSAVFYWAIHRPDLLRPSVVFLLGLLQDLLSGQPLGMSVLLFTLTYWILITQRRFFLGHSFGMLWWGFGMVAAGCALVQWAVWGLTTASLLDIRPAVFQALLGVATFPLMAWLFMKMHRTFLS